MKGVQNDKTKLTFSVVAVNMLVMFLYDAIIFSSGNYAFITNAIFLLFHTVILGILATVLSNTKFHYLTLGLVISILLVMVVGFGICAANW